jgi:predicted RNase H-like HicB family nuclease
MKAVSFREYVRAVMDTATYQPCEDGPGFVALAEALSGCMTQGRTIEEARELLIDAVELWILLVLKDGDSPPVVNGCALALTGRLEEPEAAYG